MKTFNTGASFHIINKTSVKDLERRVKARYPEGLENMYLTTAQFRPNIVLDTGVNYSEDRLAELRVGPLLMR